MAKRGPASSTDITVRGGEAKKQVRPDAPYNLTRKEEIEVWERVVAAMVAEHFGAETFDLLAQYCRHVAEGDRIEALLMAERERGECDIDTYDKLLKMRERETRAASSLAGKLRITNQSRYTPQAAGTAARNNPGGKLPWK